MASWPAGLGRIRELGLGGKEAPPHLMTAYGESVGPIFPVHFRVTSRLYVPRYVPKHPDGLHSREHSSSDDRDAPAMILLLPTLVCYHQSQPRQSIT